MVRRSGTRPRKRSAGGSAFLLFVFLIVLAAGALWFLYVPESPQKETFVEIAPGSGSRQIAQQLEKSSVVRSRFAFDLVRLWKRGTLKAGEYRFDRPATPVEVYSRIMRGDVYTVPVTIPEGATRFDIATRVEEAGLVDKALFLEATAKDIGLIADLDPHARSLEGYLFPDTYHFQRKATAAQIAGAMVHRFRAVASEIGLTPGTSNPGAESTSRSEAIAPLTIKRNVHNVVTLASLVERETAVNSERPEIASVLTNRLDKNMPLMTDPAVIYGLQTEGKWRGTIYASDLNDASHDTPYNTYRHAGLPPGPIANPGLPALKAALSPATTNYLYFVAAGADPQGKSRFASTLEEHNKNVASYRQAVRQAGSR